MGHFRLKLRRQFFRTNLDAVAKVLAEEFGFSVNGEVRDLRQNVATNPATPSVELRTSPLGVNGNGIVNGNGKPLAGPPLAESGASNGNGLANLQFLANPASGGASVQNESQTVVMEQLSISSEPSTHNAFDFCPSCGAATLAHEEGCGKCYSCGYSEC